MSQTFSFWACPNFRKNNNIVPRGRVALVQRMGNVVLRCPPILVGPSCLVYFLSPDPTLKCQYSKGVFQAFFFLQCLINAGAISNYRCKQATISWWFALPPKEWPLFSKLFMFNAIGDLWFLRKSFQNLNWRIRRVPQCLDLKRP